VFSDEAVHIAEASGVQLEWVLQACKVRAIARSQLADVRSEALLDWLKDELRDASQDSASE
jgi:hypothetical protein